ncbi:3-demethylubiquinone-9 3-methyltransferase [Arthrobacter sp. ERGS1:01]|uniref:VOC family protein n=1 Tax=Arthrobacter sp. ERGS1:01 TaxID=1704044 RepID=UPI0006B42906|nr:VOC family protein [Arthrobacter sp. ERGS1:01]ALE06298.1 3-demethylubiquinone-9 3-methyltransferase [Arthrobacter sp. ERGS1:01]
MTITPFLMFTGQAEEAMDFYVSTFPDAEILRIERNGPEDPARAGTVRGATFRIADQTFRCIDSPPVHAFGFTPSVSFFFDCKDEAQLDALFGQLSEQGSVMMPPGQYPFAQRYAWLSDRFGVSWQLSVTAG